MEGTTDRVELILDGPAGPISLLIRPAHPGEPTLALQAEDAGAGMVTYRADGSFLQVNPTFCTMLGWRLAHSAAISRARGRRREQRSTW